MRFLLGTLLGFMLGSVGLVLAQSGSWMDNNANQYQSYTFPGGATTYRDQLGNTSTLYQAPTIGLGADPCRR